MFSAVYKILKERIKMKKVKQWLKAAAVRAVKTIAQTAVATIGTSAVIISAEIGRAHV